MSADLFHSFMFKNESLNVPESFALLRSDVSIAKKYRKYRKNVRIIQLQSYLFNLYKFHFLCISAI